MNNISILPELTKSFLQKQNIKHNFYKKFQSNNTDDIKIDNN